MGIDGVDGDIQFVGNGFAAFILGD